MYFTKYLYKETYLLVASWYIIFITVYIATGIKLSASTTHALIMFGSQFNVLLLELIFVIVII